jgi:hypothetical protein
VGRFPGESVGTPVVVVVPWLVEGGVLEVLGD